MSTRPTRCIWLLRLLFFVCFCLFLSRASSKFTFFSSFLYSNWITQTACFHISFIIVQFCLNLSDSIQAVSFLLFIVIKQAFIDFQKRNWCYTLADVSNIVFPHSMGNLVSYFMVMKIIDFSLASSAIHHFFIHYFRLN